MHLRIQACDELGQVWKNLEFTGPDAKAEILGTTGDIETRRITIKPEHERKFLRLVVEYP